MPYLSVCLCVCALLPAAQLPHVGAAVTNRDHVQGAAWPQARPLAPRGHVCSSGHVRGAAWPQAMPPQGHVVRSVQASVLIGTPNILRRIPQCDVSRVNQTSGTNSAGYLKLLHELREGNRSGDGDAYCN